MEVLVVYIVVYLVQHIPRYAYVRSMSNRVEVSSKNLFARPHAALAPSSRRLSPCNKPTHPPVSLGPPAWVPSVTFASPDVPALVALLSVSSRQRATPSSPEPIVPLGS
jgi:hypothetical protein